MLILLDSVLARFLSFQLFDCMSSFFYVVYASLSDSDSVVLECILHVYLHTLLLCLLISKCTYDCTRAEPRTMTTTRTRLHNDEHCPR